MAEKHLRNLITGFVMGAVSFLPGVSGGFVAMIAGIYERLIDSVGDVRHKWVKDFFFLAFVMGGMAIGMFVASKGIEKIYERYQLEMLFFFLGLIIMQLPDVFSIANEKKEKLGPIHAIMFAIGFAAMIVLLITNVKIYDDSMAHTIEHMLLAAFMGVIVGMSKVIPGLSWATIFLALGLYEFKVNFVSHLDLYFLIPLGIGFVIGVVVFARIMTILIKRWHSQTYYVLCGIIVGSVPVIFNSIPINSTEDWIIGIVFLIMGGIVGRIVSVYSRKLRATIASENASSSE